MRLAYLHGFGSGPDSKKGRALATAFVAVGTHMHRLDLNRPSFSELTFTASLAALDDWYRHDSADADADGAGSSRALAEGPKGCPAAPEPVGLVGSSLGGYLAARWAELNPTAIEALVLLCPGLDMVQRWPTLLGAGAMARWRETGTLPLPDARGVPTAVHWRFIEDALTHPALPRPTCPTLVIHGVRDAIVPIEGSRAWVATLPAARLVEVDDGHELYASMPLIISETIDFLTCPAR